ncbi:MAG: hypothetical protein U9O78_04820 [Patescibacteria group bacterium]|nr:hypothetical protein [Patescibacteria group bacterium]
MKGYKKFLFFGILLFTAIFGLYFASKQGLLEGTFLEKYDFEKLNLLNQENLEQTKTLTNKAQETGEHIQKVLGESVEADDDEKKPIHEKTIEYARYLYCKQVVKNWEKE